MFCIFIDDSFHQGNQKYFSVDGPEIFQCCHKNILVLDNQDTLLQGRDATPYLERNRVGRDAIDAASALTDMGKYLFLERRLPVYDIAVAITKLDMCRWTLPSVQILKC